MNALKATLPSLTLNFMDGKWEAIMIKYRKWFSGDKLPPSMRKSSETDSKKKASLKQSQNSLKMSPVAEKKG